MFKVLKKDHTLKNVFNLITPQNNIWYVYPMQTYNNIAVFALAGRFGALD